MNKIAKKRAQRAQRRDAMPGAVAHAVKRSLGRATTSETPALLRVLGAEVPPGLHEYMSRRVGFKLSKFAFTLQQIEVRLGRERNGPQGSGYRCVVEVCPAQGAPITLHTTAPQQAEAFDLALESAERAVRRHLEHAQARRFRGPGRPD